ncbi:helix-turn-helix domain-containing protein [Nonomuraea sp. NPDC050310]|uniref:ArsR/SmtB family transcription factor n=1 Tax=Nonomuraea sp. NPDC050310 TaxID=3154935 RepID=UPI0033EE0A2D
MGWWQVDADTLASSRFVISEAAEATACLFALHRPSAARPGDREWLDAHLPAYRARLAADPVTALLVRTALGRAWIADFVTPTPPLDAHLDEELDRIRATPPETAWADLEVAARGQIPAELRRGDLGDRLADLLAWVWAESALPYWPKRRRVLEADVVARTGHLTQGGWAAALDDLRPGMRWLGGSRLQINTHDYPPRDVKGAQLLFVPVTPRQAWVSWDAAQRRFAVIYPCSGLLAAPAATPVPRALARLVGTARAAVLMLLDSPKSTTQLVALTGQSLGSVGGHLKVLRDAGLVERRRAGRSVLYYRAPAGETLVNASR